METLERQRFTICHEIAHVVLELPSSHEDASSHGYVKRDENEVWCDMFAAELLMPQQQFKKDLDDQEPSINLVDILSKKYCTSFPATASRVSHSDKDQIRATYNHAMYVEQRRKMMQEWADRIDQWEQEGSQEIS